MIKNEKIKASEVHVTGIHGEDLGIMPTAEALKLARQLKVDLVCNSLFSSPPPCQLIGAGAARQKQQQESKQGRPAKLKEIRLTASIEDHDYETKQQQARRLLQSGHSVMLVVKTGNNKQSAAARKLLEDLLRDLKTEGRPATGIQVSGKQSMVQLDPLN